MAWPPKYKTAKELQDKIEEYFNAATESKDKITITGLILACGYESRQSFYDLEKNDALSYTIKRARLMIECHYEKMLQGNSVAGPIFALKNLGWTDSTSIDHTSKGERINPINITVDSNEQRDKLNRIGDKDD